MLIMILWMILVLGMVGYAWSLNGGGLFGAALGILEVIVLQGIFYGLAWISDFIDARMGL